MPYNRNNQKAKDKEEAFRKKTNPTVANAYQAELERQYFSRDTTQFPMRKKFSPEREQHQDKIRAAAQRRLNGNNRRNADEKERFKSKFANIIAALESNLSSFSIRENEILSVPRATSTIYFPSGPALTIPLMTKRGAPLNKQQPVPPLLVENLTTSRLLQDLLDSPDDEFAFSDSNSLPIKNDRSQNIFLRPLSPDSEIARDGTFKIAAELSDQLLPGTRLANQLIQAEKSLLTATEKSTTDELDEGTKKRARIEIESAIFSSRTHILHITAYFYYVPDAKLLGFLQFFDEAYLRRNPRIVDIIIERCRQVTRFNGDVTSIRLWNFYLYYPGRSRLNSKDIVNLQQLLNPFSLTPENSDGLNDLSLLIPHVSLAGLLQQYSTEIKLHSCRPYTVLNTPTEQQKIFVTTQENSTDQIWKRNSLYCKRLDEWLTEYTQCYGALPITLIETSAVCMHLACLTGWHDIDGLIAPGLLANMGISAIPSETITVEIVNLKGVFPSR
ncbi:hypothetical protein GJ496_006352 [Pomphorhynchus laevis]|nr:hypothetical protein GJ496_006352 [Pomphorhynchus laevis]